MINPINIYLQTRQTDKRVFNRVWKHSTNQITEVKVHEIQSLRLLADKLSALGVSIKQMDGFFFGYVIPQISKEFDLLKFTNTCILDIELKSQAVSLESIATQLRQNRYYLSHLQKETALFTVVTDTMTCYTLDKHGRLRQVEIERLAEQIKKLEGPHLTGIEGMFRPSRFLVSPLNEPQKFIRGEYFLTSAQENIKKDILSKVSSPTPFQFLSITGKPGSGKTLLLYDLARTLARRHRALLIHCGKLTDGQAQLSAQLRNFRIVSAQRLNYEKDLISKYDVICLDETQRIYLQQFRQICSQIQECGKVCIFSSDPGQVLSLAERNNAITDKIAALPGVQIYKLTERIRTNKEISSFVTRVLDLQKRPYVPTAYPNVTITYANTVAEAQQIVAYFRKDGYVFINFSKSNKGYSPYSQYEEDMDTHHAIGQEFNRVIAVLDDAFYYSESGWLCAQQHPNPNYLYTNLFYQAVSRVREKMALVIVNNPKLYDGITSIFDGEPK